MCRLGDAAVSGQPVRRRVGFGLWALGLERRNEVPKPPERPFPVGEVEAQVVGLGLKSKHGGLPAVCVFRVETQRQSF